MANKKEKKVYYTWSILTDSLSEVFGLSKMHKKGSRNISFCFFRKLSQFLVQFSNTALVSKDQYS